MVILRRFLLSDTITAANIESSTVVHILSGLGSPQASTTMGSDIPNSAIGNDYSALDITEDDLFQEWLRGLFNRTINISEELNQTLIDQLRWIFRKNFSTDLSKYPEFARERHLKNALIILFYTIIIIISVFGNFLVCKVVLSRRRLRNRTTNILILNLAFSDIVMTVFAIPVTVARLILDDWPLGSALCVLAPFIQVYLPPCF